MKSQPALLNLSKLMAGPDLYPLQVNWAQQQVLFLSVTPEFYANAPFLDQRAVPQQQRSQIPSEWAAIQDVVQAVAAQPVPAKLGMVFHVGHCGSTLLSRALALNTSLFSLREPLPLRDLCSFWLERQEPWSEVSDEGLNHRIDMMRTLWARTPSTGQLAVVKATSFCCPLAEPWLARFQSDKSVLLAVAPETYLASMVSVPTYIADLKTTAKQRMLNLKNLTGLELPALYSLSVGEIAALAYVSDLMAMHSAARSAGDRVMRQDFDAFLSAPDCALGALNAFFDAPLPAEHIKSIQQNPLFSRYSKASNYPFSTSERLARLQEARSGHSAEINKGRAWLEAFVAREAKAAHALEWFKYQP
jgi:hypothetical protein